MPWTTWGRFAHNSPRARVEVHLPCVLESRSAGQRALAPPTDGHPPDFRQPQRQFNHYTTAFQPRHGHNQPPLNHNLFTTISPTILQPLSNPAPTIGNLNPSTTDLQPPRNREPITTTPQSFLNHIPAARSRQTDYFALDKQPRLNHPSCRIQERFRHNHPTFAILCSRVTFVIFSEAP